MKTRHARLDVLTPLEPKAGLALLARLRDDFGACALKLSTEDAAMSFGQIGFWTRRCQGLMPVMVKIGGPNARNDIRELAALGVDGLIAPMVESPYGLENFMQALKTYTSSLEFARLKKQINIETLTAAFHLDSILALPEARELDEITIGCSDLSQSMRLQVTDPKVTDLVADCTRRIRAKGIAVSIGGGITPANIDRRLEVLSPSHFNTRVVTFSVRPGGSYAAAVRQALEFELEMLAQDARDGFLSPEEIERRSAELKTRLA